MLAVAIPIGTQIQPPNIVTEPWSSERSVQSGTGINIFGLTSGQEATADATTLAFRRLSGTLTDIGKPGWEGRTAQRVV
jgi:hypothetical protein